MGRAFSQLVFQITGTEARRPSLEELEQIEKSAGTGIAVLHRQSLNADLDVRASDGSIKCDLPRKLDGNTRKVRPTTTSRYI